MSEDDHDDEAEPAAQVRFGTEPIARMLWADIERPASAGRLTYEMVAAALDKAMVTHVARTAKAERDRRGIKPN